MEGKEKKIYASINPEKEGRRLLFDFFFWDSFVFLLEGLQSPTAGSLPPAVLRRLSLEEPLTRRVITSAVPGARRCRRNFLFISEPKPVQSGTTWAQSEQCPPPPTTAGPVPRPPFLQGSLQLVWFPNQEKVSWMSKPGEHKPELFQEEDPGSAGSGARNQRSVRLLHPVTLNSSKQKNKQRLGVFHISLQ